MVIHLFNGDIRSIGAVQNFEAVLEEGLALVVSHLQGVNRSGGTTTSGTGPRNTNGDIVDSTGTQGERTCGLHETAVCWSITHCRFCPTVRTILGNVRILTHRTPVTRVGKAREHEVAIRTCSTVLRMSICTIFHFQVILPKTTQHIVVFESDIGVTDNGVVIIVINESSHTETFVIHNTVTKVHTIDSFCADENHRILNHCMSLFCIRIRIPGESLHLAIQ